VLNKQREESAERDRERIRLLTADPFDPEAQQRIAEEIRQEPVSCYSSSSVVKMVGFNLGNWFVINAHTKYDSIKL